MDFIKRAAYFSLLFLFIFLSLGLISVRAQTDQPTPSPSQTKSYYYPSIATTIHINKDSTIDVTEQQTYSFTGNFHAGERDILLQKISGVTDFSVTDVTTGVPLTESSARLDILTSSSWGKFAVWKNSDLNSQSVEWYFNLQNATHTWAVSYKVHGAIEFDKPYDRLYWNIFSGYDVPVEHADASVVLPEAVPPANISETYYRSNSATVPTDASSTQPSYANDTFIFTADSFAPNEAYTIDVTWPKGIVSEQAFWWDLFYLELPMIVMMTVVLFCLLFLFLWWLFAIKLRERPRNIIPQYEPPDGLLPAVAEVVATEKVTSKGFAATIVDLAVRGWVRIEDDNTPGLSAAKVGSIIMASVLCLIIVSYGGLFLSTIIASWSSQTAVSLFFTAIILAVIIMQAVVYVRKGFKKSDYRITALKDFAADPNLKDYEKQYLSLIFSVGDGKSVSTKSFKKLMGMQAREFYQAITKLRVAIGAEANKETDAFAVFHVKKVNPWYFVLAVLIFLYIFSADHGFGWNWTIAISVIAIALTVWTVVRMARRTAQGKILHDEWLGFKLYLEVAEKYQLQNLTPDLFEKYLPYAMVFGIEKKWAKVFERANIGIEAPSWYGGPAGVMAVGAAANTGTAFSATAFSTGFSSSFSSAIASSIGGGGAGGAGGGGAGGGGGGGGGGAR
jgi:uncharacterized membrane protein YgcG